MSVGPWFGEMDFPQPNEFENSVKLSSAVKQTILSEYRIQMGKSPTTTVKRTAESFGELYTQLSNPSQDVVTRSDVEWAVQWAFDDANEGNEDYTGVSDHSLETVSGWVESWMGRLEWMKADTDYCHPESDLSEEESLFVKAVDVELEDLTQESGSRILIDTRSIREYLDGILQSHDQIGSNKETVFAYSAAVQSLLDSRGWLPLEAKDSSLRLWANPDSWYEVITERLGDEVKVSDDELQSMFIDIIQDILMDIDQDYRFDVANLINSFHAKFNSQGWEPVRLHDDIVWIKTAEALKEEVDERLSKYGEIFANPSEEDWDIDYDTFEEELSLRQQTLQFFEDNKRVLCEFDFYEKDELEEQLVHVEFHIEADESFRKMHNSETRGGTYTIPIAGDNQNEESEQDQEAEDEIDT